MNKIQSNQLNPKEADKVRQLLLSRKRGDDVISNYSMDKLTKDNLTKVTFDELAKR